MMKEYLKKKWIFIIIFFLTLIIYLFYRDNYREECLKKTFVTYAILEDISSGSSKGAGFVEFYFKNDDNKIIHTKHIGKISICEDIMKKGDTIMIKYSLTDNSVAEIVHCYWNEELKREIAKQSQKAKIKKN